MRERLHGERDEVRAAVRAELGEPDPSLETVFSLIGGAMDTVRSELADLRERSLALYAGLDERQRAVVASAIAERMDCMERWRRHWPSHRPGFHGRG